MTSPRVFLTPSVCVRTISPSSAGTVQEATLVIPLGPSMSTIHIRQAPKGFIPG